MSTQLEDSLDRSLARATRGDQRVPGVVAMASNRRGNFYERAVGVRSVNGPTPMTTDTVMAILSTTKAVAATACLILVDDGRLDLDIPAKEYLPAIGELQVFDGFGRAGELLLRPPKRDITTRMLLLHTAGLAYPDFNHLYQRLVREYGMPDPGSALLSALQFPLVADPGEAWEYGLNLDWAGQVLEAVTGQRLGDVMRESIFEPLSMNSTAFTLTPDMRRRLALIHTRTPDGLAELNFVLPQDPEIHMAGHGLYSTVGDYMKFIRMWLNDGAGPAGQVVRAETIAAAAVNGLGELTTKALPGANPQASNAVDFFPGTPKSWAMSFMVNDVDAPTGRPAGSLSWAGLANLYFWIDRHNGIGGFWGTQIFPFADPFAWEAFLDFETIVYDHLEEIRP